MADRHGMALGRRGFLRVVALGTAGFAIGFDCGAAEDAASSAPDSPATFGDFVRIGSDDTVTVVIKHLDKGQGVTTGLTTIVADELDADWAQMRWAFAPADATRYHNLNWGPVQGTGGSSSIANSWQQLRLAGAAARAILVEAAASAWQVPAAEIVVAAGVLTHPGGRSARFGSLAAAAAALTPPAEPVLKTPAQFTFIGKHVPRIDSPDKTTGRAQFTIDQRLPGMLTAVVARPPRFGGRVQTIDDTAARAVKGVVDVVRIPRGVAVLADSTWAAIKGRDALQIEWDDSDAEQRGSQQLLADFRQLAATPGAAARNEGDVDAAFTGAAQVIEATYEFPYLAHASMEPLDALIALTDGGCEVWTGCQSQTSDQRAVADVLGLAPAQVTVHTLIAGGSFGRRAVPDSDFVVEAATIVKAIGGRAPVKLQWTREDDMRGGRYRPMCVQVLRGALDAAGQPVAWSQRIVTQSFLRGTAFEGMIQNGVDITSVEGARGLPYAIPNLRVDLHNPEAGVPTLWWRSVGHSFNGYTTETFIDEMAAAAGQDAVEFRRALLKDAPRHLAALDLAVAQAGTAPTGKGRGRGVAVHESFGSVVAEVADVVVDDDGRFKVERVTCAVDCGIAVNPDIVRAQMEGGVGYALSALLREAVTLDAGRVVEANFDRYRPLRIHEMPVVDVHIVPSDAPPSGVGEPGVPPLGPAVANALRAATGKPQHRLPLGERLA